jgi:hypothetical protein
VRWRRCHHQWHITSVYHYVITKATGFVTEADVGPRTSVRRRCTLCGKRSDVTYRGYWTLGELQEGTP